ncbi:acyl carrier protein phosphodiesterase [Massilia endophytica]|uniref:acyl carrier protein phosphodiesterase n=1 Tax=Massilia endophytica TaxID=2899220 RepID=UPI001E2D6C73|nr:ACP phosphodiesterase [Massilia endophytica]UGQ46379.1 ACP phosphodiesterase [Massilia endophytica]
MNYLAHIYLARHSDEAMVGAMLGDFVKANDTDLYAPGIAREIILHRHIDSYTDSHPVVQSAKEMFGEGRRRYAGIVLDVFYDHVLSQHWERYCDIPREELIARFYKALAEHEAILPERLRQIAPRLIQQDWLGAYGELEGVELAVNRLSTRLSRNGHLLREGLGDVRQHYTAFAQGFGDFFPDLIAYAEERRLISSP